MKNMKKKVIGILSGLCACAVCVAVPNVISADAELEKVAMVKGASVRLDNPSGLKFTAEIEGEYVAGEATSYGMMIVPYDYLVTAGVEVADGTDYVTKLMEAYEEGVIPVAPIVAENLPAKADKEGGYYIEHSIVNLAEKNFDRRFFGIAFEKVDDAYTYATTVENSRSIMEVASGALNDLYYNENISEDVKTLLESNATLLSEFVTVGLGYSADWSYAIVGDGTVGMGETLTLSVDSATNVHLLPTWSSSDDTVATVDASGVVTGLKAGTATITAINKVGDTVYTDTHEVQVVPTTPDQIVDAAYALDKGKSLVGTYTLTGAVQKKNSSSFDLVILTPTRTDKPVSCYKIEGTAWKDVNIGDTVTITGSLKNYNGTVEFDQGCTLDKVDSTVALNDKQKVSIDKANLSFGSYTIEYAGADTAEVELPVAKVGSVVTWSDEVEIVDGKAAFTFTEEKQTIKLTATITSNDEVATREFTLTVEAKPAPLPEGQVTDKISFAEAGEQKEEISVSGNFITLTFKNTTTNDKPNNSNSGHIRAYAKDEIVFTPNGGYKFVSAVIYCTSDSYMGCADGNPIAVPEGVTPVADTSAKTVTLTADEPVSEFTITPPKQMRITSIEFILKEVTVSNADKVAAVKAEMEKFTISDDMASLPIKSENNYPDEVSVAWTSDNSAFAIAADGTVTLNRPLTAAATVKVTATISHKDDATLKTTHDFEVTVDSAMSVVGEKIGALEIDEETASVPVDFGFDGITVAWTSDDPAIVIAADGTVTVTPPATNTEVTVTATVSCDEATQEYTFPVTVKAVVVSGQETTAEIIFKNESITNAAVVENNTFVGVTFTGAKGSNSNGNSPKYYTGDSTLRMYAKNTLTISVNGTISSIKLTLSSGSLTVDASSTGTATTENKVVTVTDINAAALVLTTTESTRITQVEVTYIAA